MFRIGVGSSESIYKMFLYVFVVLLVRAYCLVMLMVPLFGIFSRMKELAKRKWVFLYFMNCMHLIGPYHVT